MKDDGTRVGGVDNPSVRLLPRLTPSRRRKGNAASVTVFARNGKNLSSPRTPEYYEKRPCPQLVYDAAAILEEMLIARGVL